MLHRDGTMDMWEGDQSDQLAEAEHYHIQAEDILFNLQANLEVYGSNSILSGATPANIELALQYSDRCLEYFPENPKYLNIRALLIGDGLGQKEEAIALLRKAHELNPRDINVANNLKTFETSNCFIATAAYGTPLAAEIFVLREWRDACLLNSRPGRLLVKLYYFLGPPAAFLIVRNETLRKATRKSLRPIVSYLREQNEK